MDNVKNLEFIGTDTQYHNVHGVNTNRVYLDSAASTLTMKKPYLYREKVMGHYANLHTKRTFSSRYCMNEFSRAKKEIIEHFGFNTEDYVVVFCGSGATSCINTCARLMSRRYPSKSKVLVSLMEHHSNDLPHRKWAEKVVHIGLDYISHKIDLYALEAELKKGNVRYISITALSNVTGVMNSLDDISALAHRYGVHLIVDASQSSAHVAPPQRNRADVWIFSGHKVYAPGTTGVMIIKKSLFSDLEPAELGGGMVSNVSIQDYTIAESEEDRVQAGTTDFLGAIQISQVLKELRHIGFHRIERHERFLVDYFINQVSSISDKVIIYGPTESEANRFGIVSFNIEGISHGLLSSILNDFYCIETRNGCFCAHPYVRDLLRPKSASMDIAEKGMVRISFGLYNTEADVDCLLDALKDIIVNIIYYSDFYEEKDHVLQKIISSHSESSLCAI